MQNKTTVKKSAAKKTTTKSGNNHSSQFESFFVDSLKDMYWAEKHLIKALGKMSKAATSGELSQAFTDHKETTAEHVSRLEQVFELMGKKAQGKRCEAIEGITKEVDSLIEETEDDTFTRDAALIMGGQKAEHYEIATYGSLVQFARTLGRDEVADLLEKTLEEEKEADELLTGLAESSVNEEAIAE